nr:dihydroxy-acid dehydratase [Conexibacter arvalis]
MTSYGDDGFSRFLRRSFLASAGIDREDLDRPVVGIVDTSSDYTTCHRDMPKLVEAVRRGVLQAGGMPFVFPAMSLAEIQTSPSAMLFRNLMAMQVEESIRSQPMDAVVLLGGCDKTVPAEVMAAASADVPAVLVVTGPMMAGSWRGQRVGACTDCRRLWSSHRGGEIDAGQIEEVEQALCPTAGTCMVMGTASTMACVVEALGLMPPGSATAPAPSADRLRIGVASGRRAVEQAAADLRPKRILTRPAFENAIAVLNAIGGSTNAIVHLLAIARRAGVDLTLDDFERIAARVPLLVDCKPSGAGYLEDMHKAGGVPALLSILEPLLDTSVVDVTGTTLAERIAAFRARDGYVDHRVIRPLEDPLGPTGALAIVRGNLAPDGAVVKVAAASERLLVHQGPAIVVDSPAEATAKLDDPDLDVTPDHVLVLRNAGPVGAGMPEAGSLPIPRRLALQGVRDMVRVSDARMSGTAYGTTVLHCSPEAAIGGPLALLRDGDVISLDVPSGRVDVLLDDAELEARRAALTLPPPPERGWRRLYHQHVEQAHLGADLDFLAGGEVEPSAAGS